MAEVEIKTEAMRTSSLQKMLDLERKYKMDRLQLHSAPTSPPASPPPPSEALLGRPPLQIRRADSLSRQQNFLMLKAARRSTAPPPLSITIPEPPASGRDRDLSRRGQSSDPQQEEEDDDDDTETETTAEPLHKQVKFLAPDDEDEDDMSDQSSICQSPSWENYGQKKKEKKKEAERRKKEKEQAEKEAKAAKKRPTSRLSKQPPPSTLARNSGLVGITNAERSMSDPLLTTGFHSSVESRLARGPQKDERASSTNDLQSGRVQKRAEAEDLNSTASSKGFLGGVKLDKEKANSVQNSQTSIYPPSLPYQLIQTSGPEPRKVGTLSPTMPTVRQDSRSPRDNVFPPSSSRTPMLRHTSTSGHGRSNSLLQGAANFFRGQDGKSQGNPDTFSPSEGSSHAARDNERGRGREQGRHQRSQSTSRTTAVLQGHTSGSTNSSSTRSRRSSSRNTQNTRRSSISQEAKTMAMKLSGLKLTPSAKDEHAAYGGKDPNQVDYFNFMERSYSTSVLSAMVSGGGPAARPTTRGAVGKSDSDTTSARDTKTQNQHASTQDPTPTSRQPSFKEQSIASGSQGKKGRSLKDAAKAALHIGTPTNNSKPTVSAPPYLAFRTRMQSQNSNSGEKKQSSTHSEQTPAPVQVSLPVTTISSSQGYIPITRGGSSGQPSSSNSVKTAELETQAGSRASEGSSSTSSAYEDGSPLPSPNTTPDTSRPQSSKDMPLHGEDTAEAKEGLSIQDDETTLRQSSDSSGSSNSSTTPRLAGSADLKGPQMTNEERWSRTALPLEIDGDADAQSFTTSISRQDSVEDGPEKVTLGTRKDATQSHAEILHSIQMSMSRPRLAKSLSDPALRLTGSDIITQTILLPLEEPVAIPARSKRRISPVESRGEGLPRGEDIKRTSGDSQREDLRGARMVQAQDDARSIERPSELKAAMNERAHPDQDFRDAQEAAVKREARRERHGGKRRHHERDQPAYGRREEPESGRGTPNDQDMEQARRFTLKPTANTSMTRNSTSSSLASSNSSKSSLKSPRTANFPHSSVQENHGHSNSQEPAKARSSPTGSRVSTPEPATLAVPSKPSGPARVASAPTPTTETSSMLPVTPLGPSASRPAGPVSILKQPTRSTSDPLQGIAAPSASTPSSSSARTGPQPPQVLSALPKHMQLQAGISVKPPPTAPDSRMAPVAKMFVVCCNCKFYHDMPSKLYECMAKPDAVVEDRTLGISGAITTMVKCPWCSHNMSTSCCAGYAAVVYLKEKLH